MKNKQTGFIGIAIIILIALVAVGGGTYVYTQQKMNTDIESNASIEMEANSTSTTSTSSTTTTNSMQKSLEEAKENLNASVGKKLVTEASVRTDSKGNPVPALIVDPKVAADVVVEGVGSNPAYVRSLIKSVLKAMAAGFQYEALIISKANNGSYATVCNQAKTYLTDMASESMDTGDEFQDDLTKKLGMTVNSYRINELVCRSNDSGFVATVPLTLEDGTNTKMCMSSKGFAYGEADFETMTCVKK